MPARVPASEFADDLLAWWYDHGRKDLPWQKDPTPYRVWVSEIMLQQTQVASVERYFDVFIEAFPTVRQLASADQDQVLHRWSGLGYYARARNLHRAAAVVCERHDGELPGELDALMALPGIGRSTAGAILALSMNRAAPILDGNAKRVLARVFGITGWPGESAVARKLWAIAEECTPQEQAAQYTQAIMDLGATLCVRRNPQCERCPFDDRCVASRKDCVHSIPGSRPRRDRPERSMVLALVVREDDGAVLLERRPPEGIWGGLWGFPELESVEVARAWCREQVGHTPRAVEVTEIVRHSFTHFELNMTPVRLRVRIADDLIRDSRLSPDRWLWYKRDRPAEVGLAAPVARLLANEGEIR